MYWTKLILLNLSIFIIWGKLLSYSMYNTYIHKNSKRFTLEGTLEDIDSSYYNLISINKLINNNLSSLRSSLFFKIFKVNFDQECNLMAQNSICNFQTCTICTCDEKEIPLPWKQDSNEDHVDKTHSEVFKKWTDKYDYSSPQQWLVESEVDTKKGIFVNLEKNPEAFTGYQGEKIWNAIYLENCFINNNMCSEEKLFFRIISGLHSNINIHLGKFHLDSVKNVTYLNSKLINDRVSLHSERINNLFFLNTLLLTTLNKAKETLINYNYETGNKEQDDLVVTEINRIYKRLDISDSFKNITNKLEDNSHYKKFMKSNKIKELKMRFRNISSLIDCVGCQKCRLHGKLQIIGLSTMFKILFDKNDIVNLKRNELIAFVNLVGKVSNAIKYLEEVKFLIEKDEDDFIVIVLISIFILILTILYMNWYFLKNKKLLESKMIKRTRDYDNYTQYKIAQRGNSYNKHTNIVYSNYKNNSNSVEFSKQNFDVKHKVE